MSDEWITIREAALLAGCSKNICAHLLKKLGAESCVKRVYENKLESKRVKHYKKSAVLEVAEYLEERGQTPLDVIPPGWLTIDQVAEILGVTKSTVHQHVIRHGCRAMMIEFYGARNMKVIHGDDVDYLVRLRESRKSFNQDDSGWRTVKSLAPECGIQPHAVREWIKKLNLRSRIEHFPTGWKAMLIHVEDAEYLKTFLAERRLPVPADMISEAEAVKVVGGCRSSFYRLKKRNPWLFCVESAFPDGHRRRWFRKQEILSLRRRDRELAAEIEKKRREIENLQRQRFFNPLTH